MSNEKTSGKRIKSCRKTMGMTQGELAEICRVNRVTVSSWERDLYKPEGDTLRRLAFALMVSPAYLIEMSDDPTEKDLPEGVELNMQNRTLSSDGIVRGLPHMGDVLSVPVLPREYLRWSEDEADVIDMTNYPKEAIPWPKNEIAMINETLPPFAIIVDGDQLESIGIHNGDRAVINPEQFIAQGAVGLVLINGSPSLKYVYQLRNGDALLRCDAGDLRLTKEQQQGIGFRTLGAVIGVYRAKLPVKPLFEIL